MLKRSADCLVRHAPFLGKLAQTLGRTKSGEVIPVPALVLAPPLSNQGIGGTKREGVTRMLQVATPMGVGTGNTSAICGHTCSGYLTVRNMAIKLELNVRLVE